ncbi:Alpha-ketoglutarate-dependent dioxygenase alkB [Ananas comosus]|uniref:Alpha-ketoglutarate-dependent dioxygenase alkB n=1 Tax=Ananas comosus TaxID=4615 RepID=A0A199V863_ANACO|nr:Alpha-ketoglutarate-dependent dioxygenase alkB [Ananas comosus]
MASPLTTHSLTHLFFYLATYLLLTSVAFGHEFRVGGPRGWTEPIGDEFESYNHWATRNRFHIGDYLYFKYENDSVLVVTHDEYKECNTTNPIAKFTDGDTKFRFDRYGFFYFISGEPSHCWAGQRLIVRVMVHPETGKGVIDLGNGSEVIHIPRFVPWDQAWEWYEYLDKEIPWTRPMIHVFGRSCVQVHEALPGSYFNSLVLNRYKGGSDYVSWHSDDERSMTNSRNASLPSV